MTDETCIHGTDRDVRCGPCERAADIGRPPGGGPTAVRLIVARHDSNCPACGRNILPHQDRIGCVDGAWLCEDCTREATR